ncbi:type II secretion system F family protein [Pseudomonas qingdaonensis]|uniref:Type II secretion system F family protein n=1 Tax=Pseudomonas qingdaonensis TaxID=2056231 RepID=A0ABX8DSH1_9PSED|nr:type II secretion system F family protein [Pseudomonas qingdaonensis]QVL18974.1 type II secretion system F family protein [Pseudomonas qingdaonensis]
MSFFRYQAMDGQGKRQAGLTQADNYAQAIVRLQAQGLLIVELCPAQGYWQRIVGTRRQLDQTALVRFTEQLATLLEAGQPLESALALQARQANRQHQRELLEGLLAQVKAGTSLSSAMGRQSSLFSPFYLSLVRAGEASGTLGDTMAQLAAYLERTQSQRSELISALIYPAFLVAGVMGSLMLLLAYVVPQFVPVFSDLGIALPMLTEAILWLGEGLARWGAFSALSLALFICCALFTLRAPQRRLKLDAWLLRRGALGRFLQELDTARLAQTLGTLLNKRVALLASLDIARQVASNRAMQSALGRAAEEVREGTPLVVALTRTQLFPELAVQMIGVGEQSGQLGSILLKVARIYDKQNQTSIKRFMAALVPTLTLVMTLLVALIMLAILLPLMSLTSNI